MRDYIEFAESELKKLIPVQEKFVEKYNLESYKSWFYDSETELLRLYNSDEDEIFFKYIPIGNFSLNKKTWMWSWFNNYLTEKNKNKTFEVKDFGVENQFEKLIEGTFDSSEFDCWKFLAISKKILGGIGCYQINCDNLNLYVLLTEKIKTENNLEVKQLKQKTVDCGIHGYERPAFVCQHLNLETTAGFEEAFDTEKGMDLDEDEDLQAWCDECEKVRIKYDGWNEQSMSFARIKLVCENCYFEMRHYPKKCVS
jgi:hypothetical protein